MKENMEEFMRKIWIFLLNLSDWGSYVFCIIDYSCDLYGILGMWYVFIFVVSCCMNFFRYCGWLYFELIKICYLFMVWNLNVKFYENFVFFFE